MNFTAVAAPAQTFSIDKSHSDLLFQVRHLVTRVRGRFTDFSGTVAFDPESPSAASVALTINAASIDTGTPDRDTHLRSADFFDVVTYPTLTFVSSRIDRVRDDRFDVTGPLTIHGVAREVTLPVTYLGLAKDPWGNERAGFESEITINRKDFGLAWNTVLETGGFVVGDDVKITLSVQAIANKEQQ
jgi:polyisoprenoid-binding protein YceI